MESNPDVSNILLKTGAYRDLEKPVILTSGELGIYYINTEKILQDNGEFEKHGDSDEAMMDHTLRMMDGNPDYKRVIVILADMAEHMLTQEPGKHWYISGGQRRDWLFSEPVAHMLSVDHMALFKQKKGEPSRTSVKEMPHIYQREVGDLAVHVADLLTEGSSFYRVEDSREMGWLPMLKNKGITVHDAIVVVTRNQGGEANLEARGVKAHALVSIDDAFLGKYSKFPERAVEYYNDPRKWSENYLSQNGALEFVGAFDPNGGKVDRAKRFLDRYMSTLKQADRFHELKQAIEEKYGMNVYKIVGLGNGGK